MSQRETGTEARQGERGKPTLVALMVGVVLALAVGGLLLIYQGANSPTDPSSQSIRGESNGSNGSASREQPANPSNPAPAEPKP